MRRRAQLARRAVALVALTFIASRSLAAQAPKIGAGAVSAQLATGLLGTMAGFLGGGLFARSFVGDKDSDRASRVGYIGAYAGLMLLTPVGPALIGSRGDDVSGSYGAAQLGSIAGFAGSALVKALGDHGAFDCKLCLPVRIVAATAIVMLPSVGSTIAYDMSRKRPAVVHVATPARVLRR